MITPILSTHRSSHKGFTLVMTLSILAAVTILVVGLFSIVAREKQTSTSFDAVEQADLAVQAGFENAGALLKDALKDETCLILSVPTAPWITRSNVDSDTDKILQSEEGKEGAASLMAVARKIETGGLGSFAWTYTPLVSGVLSSEALGNRSVHPDLASLRLLPRPILPGAYLNGQPTFQHVPVNAPTDDKQEVELKRAMQQAAVAVSPWQRTPSAFWVELKRPKGEFDPRDGDDEIAARFSFYIEDLQGRLPLATAGNYEPVSSLHERTPFSFPPQVPNAMAERDRDLLRWSTALVPGLNLRRPELPLLAETSLHTFFQPNVEPILGSSMLDDVLNRMHRVMLRNHAMHLSPGTWKEVLLQPDPNSAWQGLQASAVLERDTSSGSLTNPVMRRLEEQTTAGLVPYEELALIPPDPAFANLDRYANPDDPLAFIEGPARKLNLNRILRVIETEENMSARQEKARAAVDQIATHIQNHLPRFAATNKNDKEFRREGGYPLPLGGKKEDKALAYLKCLAAGIIDYADTDAVPTMDGDPMDGYPLDRPNKLLAWKDDGSKNDQAQWHDHYPRYRGMDSYPLVTEQWQRYRFEETNAGYLTFSVTTYIEIWNMTNQVINGEISAVYEANLNVLAGFRPYPLMGSLTGADPDAIVISGMPLNGDGSGGLEDLRLPGKKLPGWWHQPIRMNDPNAPDRDSPGSPSFIQSGQVPPVFKPMQPNEVRVVAFSPVVYRFNLGSTSGSGGDIIISGDGYPNPNDIDPNDPVVPARDTLREYDLRSKYRIAFKPSGASGFIVVDQPLKPVERWGGNKGSMTVNNSSRRQKFNLGLPAMSYARDLSRYANNLGDPRSSFFINYTQGYVSYTNGSSPWTRNVRENIRDSEFGQNRIHLWPDGGHISHGVSQSGRSYNTYPDDKLYILTSHASKNILERQKYVQHLSNAGRLFSVTELGHVFDPIMWDPDGGSEFSTYSTSRPNNNFYREFANLRTGNSATPSDKYCGGNTLRIGRPEHERFRPDYNLPAAPGRPSVRSLCATALLDLFHCGQPRAGWHNGELTAEEIQQLTGDLVRIHGHVNLNSASRDTLRALAAGRLVMDPRLRRSLPDKIPNEDHETTIANNVPKLSDSLLFPPSSNAISAQADLLAELIIRNRPYLTPAELPEKVLMPTATELQQRPLPRDMTLETNQPGVVLEEGQPVFGASRRVARPGIEPDRNIEPEWNDAAAEETFARVFNNATVRSRNFKIVVTGQAVRRTRSGETKVLATRSRLYHVFIRPIRDEATGNIIRQQTEITYARTL